MLLSQLSPQDVAAEVAAWALRHAEYLATLGLVSALPAASTFLGRQVENLTRYAQTGAIDGEPWALIQTVAAALYSPVHPDAFEHSKRLWARQGAVEPKHAIDVVLRASLARALIDGRDRVPLGCLGPLAGLPVTTLRRYATPSRRHLTTLRDGTITAEEAKAFLSAKGVSGF